MERFSAESSRRLRELANDLDMILPTNDESADPTQEEEYNPDMPLDTVEEQRMGILDAPPAPPPQERLSNPGRPPMRREASAPPPPSSQAPPPPPPPDSGDGVGSATDSLSLMQLRKLVTEMPRVEPTPYAFVYKDAASLPEELEEWFAYSVEERARILKTQSSFAAEWAAHNNWVFTGDEEGALDWMRTSEEKRLEFMKRLLQGLLSEDLDRRLRNLEALVYLMLGCWRETAGIGIGLNTHSRDSSWGSSSGGKDNVKSTAETANTDFTPPSSEAESSPDAERQKAIKAAYIKSGLQMEWIKKNVTMLFDLKGVQPIFEAVRMTCLRECTPDPSKYDNTAVQKEAEQRETWCALTVLYVCIEIARSATDERQRLAFRADLLTLDPNLLVFLGEIINKLRWDTTIQGVLQRRDPREPNAEKGPSTKLLLLTWKSVLVCLGGLDDVEKAKDSFREDPEDPGCKGPLITASPLEYHSFRQEISSKYPAYSPPPPLFPLDPDQKSFLPPLRVQPTKPQQPTTTVPTHQYGTSILHQPVHIATPAPSPPPSPQVGGKGGKKQNYQTNNQFPFLYPPLDESSNRIGGKGSTDLQDLLVGRKWEGRDIPTSIFEGAELFARRVRGTRALKQLWGERAEFMKFERGWSGVEDDDDVGIEALNLDADKKARKFDGSVEDRLQVVEDFYRDGLPHLQSIVMVLMKTILANVTSLITQASGQGGVQSGFHFQEGQNGTTEMNGNGNGSNGNANVNGGAGGANGNGGFQVDLAALAPDELDKMRGEDIAGKAVTGLLVLMLKWFKVSHVLKFEYLTQLLVDANYIPMVLKLLQTQEIERVVNYRCERAELNFFHFCRAHSRMGLQEDDSNSEEPPQNPQDDLSDSDDCAPPPIIKRRRGSPPIEQQQQQNPNPNIPNPRNPPGQPTQFPPEVDELGMPTTALPQTPITTYSWLSFFTLINHLRILQKIVKNKPHRVLMLITYKSSTHLKKSLKIPQPTLRLYTLKLFKGQVPYCGRKWRQGNMRVITAVYLYVKPGLRDEWLGGGAQGSETVDWDVEMAVPLEMSLRSLTHWFHVRRWPESMGVEEGEVDGERDFFRSELEKMDWSGLGLGVDGGEEGEWEGREEERKFEAGNYVT
ncbi:hypothetical protein EJ08DRAFT_636846 [Tothia fuscella]|uniref:Factor arrest protein 11 n=1 Tax=Tothia fuscella TaxID=1048955 RepID=A0A9P4TVP8_9PEZI|nr:hypothetical protein EJ08DRAFT_636846 [Tothia fuscella]